MRFLQGLTCTLQRLGAGQANTRSASHAHDYWLLAYLIYSREGMHDDCILGQNLHGVVVYDVLASSLLVLLWPILQGSEGRSHLERGAAVLPSEQSQRPIQGSFCCCRDDTAKIVCGCRLAFCWCCDLCFWLPAYI